MVPPRPSSGALQQARHSYEARAIEQHVEQEHRVQPDQAAGSPSVETDEEARRVVAAVLEGDRDAFRLLVERESASVVRVCYRVLGDLHGAEDASQEAFVTAFRSLASWRGDGPFGAWLARIALRIALRSAGRRKPVAWIDPTHPETLEDGDARRGSAGGRLDRRGPSATITAASLARAGAHDPAQLALRAERAAAVRDAVARLEEPYREIVALRFFADLSLAEIVAESGRPLGTVKTHLHRGLLRLRRMLESDGAA